MSEIQGEDNRKYKPYENTGIEEGDTIIKVNDTHINSTDDLIECVNMSNGYEVNCSATCSKTFTESATYHSGYYYCSSG